jgi:hypothetical protein
MQTDDGQNRNSHLKIAVAANQAGVSVKTIYNWIENGYLETVEPGYVRFQDVEKAKKLAEKSKSESARATIKTIFRDKNGRFSIFKTK